jgi:hypothetical protein
MGELDIPAPVHDAEDFASFAAEVPAEAEVVQVFEELDLDFAGSVLLDGDPEEAAEVREEANAADTALEELEADVGDDQVPSEGEFGVAGRRDRQTVDWKNCEKL